MLHSFAFVFFIVHSSCRIAFIYSFHLSKRARSHLLMCLVCIFIDLYNFVNWFIRFFLFTLSTTPYRVYGCIFVFKFYFMIISCGLCLVAYLIVYVGANGVCVIHWLRFTWNLVEDFIDQWLPCMQFFFILNDITCYTSI